MNDFQEAKTLYLPTHSELTMLLARELSELREAETKQPMETVEKVLAAFSFKEFDGEGLCHCMY